MRSMFLTAGAVALALAGTTLTEVARADDDLIRLDGKGDDAEVQEARFVAAGGRGFVAGGPRGFVAGGSRGFVAGGSRGFVAAGSRGFVGYRGGYWGGYRGYWGGYRGWGYRPYWGVGYRPYWGVGYRPWYGGYYGGYSYPVYADYGYYSGCSTDLAMPAPTYTLDQQIPAQPAPTPAPPGDGTYPYDGGPTPGVMPMSPRMAPRLPGTASTRMVALTSPEYQFLAFGETAQSPALTPAPAGLSAANIPVSLTFPAFGEDGVPTGGFSGGTTVYASLRK